MPLVPIRAGNRGAGLLLFAVSVGPLAAVPALAGVALGGSVRDGLGHGLAGVEVLVLGTASVLPVAVETSDAHGRFRITDLETGSYRVAALKTGYATFVGQVDTVVQSWIDVVLERADDGTTPQDPAWALRLPRRGVTRETEFGTEATAPAVQPEIVPSRELEIDQMFWTGARGAGRGADRSELDAAETALRFAAPVGGRGGILIEGRRERLGATGAVSAADRVRQGESSMALGFGYAPGREDVVDIGAYYNEGDCRLDSPLALDTIAQRSRSWGSAARWSRGLDEASQVSVGIDIRDTAVDRTVKAAVDDADGEIPRIANRSLAATASYSRRESHRHEVRLAVGADRLEARPAGALGGWTVRADVRDTWTAPGAPVGMVYGLGFRQPAAAAGSALFAPRLGARFSDGRWTAGVVASYHAVSAGEPTAARRPARVGYEADLEAPLARGVSIRGRVEYAPVAFDAPEEPLFLTDGDLSVREQRVALAETRGEAHSFVEFSHGHARGSLATLVPFAAPRFAFNETEIGYDRGRVGLQVPASGTDLEVEYRRVRTDAAVEGTLAAAVEESMEVRLRQEVPGIPAPGAWRVLVALRLGSIETDTLAEWRRDGGDDTTLDALNNRVSAGVSVMF